ncbi:MAG: hypothetical protein IJR00_09140 [Lachnospiraceae bacterium]|nr:hypothetical protein [Lachnospiraceae bacterium]
MKKSARQKKKSAAEQKALTVSLSAVSLLTVPLTAGAAAAFAFYRGEGREAFLRIVIIAFLLGAGIAFCLGSDRLTHSFEGDNEAHPWRFFGVFACCLAASLLLLFVPLPWWPVPLLFVLLQLTSESILALFAGGGLLLLSLQFVAEGAEGYFFLLFTASACTVLLYRHTDSKTRFLFAMLPQALLHLTALVVYELLFAHTHASARVFLIPIASAFLTALVTAGIARAYLLRNIRKNTERYLDINDPEFSLLQAIRTKQKEVYDLAIHTAHLTERCAEALDYRTQAAKTCALYHRIGCLDDAESEWPDVAHYYTDFEFPQEAVLLLREYIREGQTHPRSREATLVMFCDTLVTQIRAVFAKDKDAGMDYDTMIDTMCLEAYQKGTLSGSGMTIQELSRMRELLKQEKLYYDFLR